MQVSDVSHFYYYSIHLNYLGYTNLYPLSVIHIESMNKNKHLLLLTKFQAFA